MGATHWARRREDVLSSTESKLPVEGFLGEGRAGERGNAEGRIDGSRGSMGMGADQERIDAFSWVSGRVSRIPDLHRGSLASAAQPLDDGRT